MKIEFSDLSQSYQNHILMELSVTTQSKKPLLLNVFDFMSIVIFVVSNNWNVNKKEVVWNHQL